MKKYFTIKQLSEIEKKLLLDLERQMPGLKVFTESRNHHYFSSIPSTINIEVDTNSFTKIIFADSLLALESKSSARTEILQLFLDHAKIANTMRSTQYKYKVAFAFYVSSIINIIILLAIMLPLIMIAFFSPILPVLPLGLSMFTLVGSLSSIIIGLISVVIVEKLSIEKDFLLKKDNILKTKLDGLIAKVKNDLSVQNDLPPDYIEAIKTHQIIDSGFNHDPPNYAEALKTKPTLAENISLSLSLSLPNLDNNINKRVFFAKPETADNELSELLPSCSSSTMFNHISYPR